jgi:hypothetical protein
MSSPQPVDRPAAVSKMRAMDSLRWLNGCEIDSCWFGFMVPPWGRSNAVHRQSKVVVFFNDLIDSNDTGMREPRTQFSLQDEPTSKVGLCGQVWMQQLQDSRRVSTTSQVDASDTADGQELQEFYIYEMVTGVYT